MCCIYQAKEVDLVFAFNRKHCVCSEAVEEAAGFLWRWMAKKKSQNMRGGLNLSMSMIAIANTLARLLYLYVCVCEKECICWSFTNEIPEEPLTRV